MRIYLHSGVEEGPAVFVDTEDGRVHVVRVRGGQKQPEWSSVAQALKVLKAAIRIKEPRIRAGAIKAVAGFVAEQLGEEIGQGGVLVVG